MTEHPPYRLGIDIGSTTVKLLLLDPSGETLEARYMRHGAAALSTLGALLAEFEELYPHVSARMAMTGSGALSLSAVTDIPFVHEVRAAAQALRRLAPQTDTAIELGGEDAKILFLGRNIEQRMNENCAGGTGAFIDQMAALLKTDAAGLDALAAGHAVVYPIAARCGVFAKTDVVTLINEGAAREDIAASIFQAVVDQTIGGLACGRSIRGYVAFLGGPLHFLPRLRERFELTLNLDEEHSISPPQAQYAVALGAALAAGGGPVTLAELRRRFTASQPGLKQKSNGPPPLFANDDEYRNFLARHAREQVPHSDAADSTGDVFLGLDVGSTTVKAVLTDALGRVLVHGYRRNRGNPLPVITGMLADMLDVLPPAARLRCSAATGYGAEFACVAVGVDIAEVETVAHSKAACALRPDVSFLLDIGGQDIKCLQIRDGRIRDILLNEACSAGCGAFLENFAAGLHMSIEDFVRRALASAHPVDLGTRCTVFMNSKVKQAQKEGAGVEDIAAGLCYSVIRNALYKVLRIRGLKQLGDNIVVQGGSFSNDALLRALELLLGREVYRPHLSGLMGAYGAAIIARERASEHGASSLLSAAAMRNLTCATSTARCRGCHNRCVLTTSNFSDGRAFRSGNRCSKGSGRRQPDPPPMPDIFAWKQLRLFEHYHPLPENEARRGSLGIPRVLNMFENYPFWFTLFSELGYRVELSAPTSKSLYDSGLASMPSQSACYPAKLAHGHIHDLIHRGLKKIFFPCINTSRRFSNPPGSAEFNCPVVAGYPQVVRLNAEELRTREVTLLTPFLTPHKPGALAGRLREELGLPKAELRRAIRRAAEEQARYRAELRAEGERILNWIEKTHSFGVILAGRPYHADPGIHHGLPGLICSLGAAVLSEDAVAHLAEPGELRVVDQWSYHSRLYHAAALTAQRPHLEMVQITSFGCGIDAVTADQVAEILAGGGKMHTLIKIDEGSSLGAARIRIRSLMAAVRDKQRTSGGRPFENVRPAGTTSVEKALFTDSMRATHDILIPQMAPLHFPLVEEVLRRGGYRARLLEEVRPEAVDSGLAHVHNDACYPALVTIGQLMHALQNGLCDPEHSALLLSQTGGSCRATNYIPLLRKALQESGMQHIPVLSFNIAGMDSQPGFRMDGDMLRRGIRACIYGDLLQRLSLRTRPYEKRRGDSTRLTAGWTRALREDLLFSLDQRRHNAAMLEMTEDFAGIPVHDEAKPRVGIVGEILLKYHPAANNNAVDLVEAEGGEAVLPDITDFVLYNLYDSIYRAEKLGGRLLDAMKDYIRIRFVERMRAGARKALKAYPRFGHMPSLRELIRMTSPVISLGNQAGEGWLLTADMIHFIRSGVPNILCLQPFGCLPNHITGKGVVKELTRRWPESNIGLIDYDPGASEANQINRIKLIMAAAHEKLDAAFK
jgi:predicted CoA-substrate-specific enzyme activase